MTATRQPATERPTVETVLITAGTGKTGSRIVGRLARRPGVHLRVGSRSGSGATVDGQTSTTFDWADAATWEPALRGVDAAYISFYPDLAAPGAVDAVEAFVDLAVAARVRRLVLLSGRGEAEAKRSEEIVQASGAEWTIVRSSWFSQNFSESFLFPPILDGYVALPVDSVTEPFIDADDIADVVAPALVEDGHVGQLYEVTGPRSITFAAAVAEIAQASGRPIRFETISVAEFKEALGTAGLPPDEVVFFEYLFTDVLDGRNSQPTDGVRLALDRSPRDFAEYARAAAATGVWTI